jgi:hypothetical protein
MAKMYIQCSECSNQFKIEKKTFNQKSKQGRINFWCSDFCRKKFLAQERVEEVQCCGCRKPFSRIKNLKKEKKFCSRSCASRRPASLNRKKKVSETYRNKFKDVRLKLETIITANCVRCQNQFERKIHSTTKYCSTDCRVISYKSCGGYRKGSGRSKHGWYENVHFDSTYELAFWLENRNNGLQRSYKRFPFRSGYYVPDFIQGNKYIEVKGYLTQVSIDKIEAVKKLGIEIELVCKEIIIPLIDKYKKQFNVKCLLELYDK